MLNIIFTHYVLKILLLSINTNVHAVIGTYKFKRNIQVKKKHTRLKETYKFERNIQV